MKQIAGPGLMHETRYSGLVHWDDPEGWDGEGDRRGCSGWGTHVYPWLIHVNVWQNQYRYYILEYAIKNTFYFLIVTSLAFSVRYSLTFAVTSSLYDFIVS